MSSAGTFEQRCDTSKDWRRLPVKVQAPGSPPTNSFLVTWATSAAPDAYRYTVSYRIGTEDWSTWKTGTPARSATFAGSSGTTYTFRAKTVNAAGSTGWSPTKRVVT